MVDLRLPAVAAVLGLLLPCGTPDAHTRSSPPLQVSENQLAAALHCPARLHRSPDPVLLIHGASSNGEESWSWNYAKTLTDDDYSVCTIDLPDFSMGDTQVSAEYVVAALRKLRKDSGRKVDVITHSWGGVNLRWALRWWPDLARSIDDAILLAPPSHGGDLTKLGCAARSCPPLFWQAQSTSAFMGALDAGEDETPDGPSYTVLYSGTDQIVFTVGGSPNPWTASSALDGATNIRMQDFCRARPVEHIQFLYDAAVHALVLDALENKGTADASRAGTGICAAVVMSGVNPSDPLIRSLQGGGGVATRSLSGQVDAEPALAPYATR